MRRIAAVVVLAMLVGACGTGVSLAPESSVTAPSQASVPASPTPEPSPATWTAEQAGAMYLKIAKPYSDALARQNKAKLTLSAQKKAWKATAAAADTYLERLKAIPWPAEAADEAEALIRATILFQAQAQQLSKAKDIDQLNQWSKEAQRKNFKAIDAAALLRDVLGLPPPGA